MKITRRQALRHLVTGAGAVAAVATPVGRRIWQVGAKLEVPLGSGQVRMPDGTIVQLSDFKESDKYDSILLPSGGSSYTPGAPFNTQEPPTCAAAVMAGVHAHQMKAVDEALRQMRDYGVRIDWGHLAKVCPDVELGDLVKRAFDMGMELHIGLHAA